ncbi:histidine phosphatase family protein [Maritimibacter sp. DP1N21-5]|uniref:histidine phosphatase family protein n=1 Tax=Maritimibacter sp. DP1N21-5 TaxID=2836867 RepID=UPI001C47C5DA|nr:histidine phosphatase family protein [Maritimibacter sp. DP1N21-5]MBV7407880.1 histidine phosphatase family protein [Maritimibacter sp. DP1N21-5]
MSQITLIRHGQANNASNDEHGYDKLSELGHQQAEWLGDYLRASGEGYARVYSGTLRRHRETAAAVGFGPVIEDARLNEVAYFDLSARMHEQMGIAHPTGRDAFIEHLPLVFTAWRDGQIKGAQETFQDFEQRVGDVLHEISEGEGRALVVTSGGLISMGIRVSMGLEIGAMARMALAIMNTSVHQMHPIGASLSLTQFNAVPHLADPSREFARTFV